MNFFDIKNRISDLEYEIEMEYEKEIPNIKLIKELEEKVWALEDHLREKGE